MTTPGGNIYNLRFVVLPLRVFGAVVLLEDDTFDVFLNAAVSEEMQQKALSHEIAHIDNGHLYNDIYTVADLEREADKLCSFS